MPNNNYEGNTMLLKYSDVKYMLRPQISNSTSCVWCCNVRAYGSVHDLSHKGQVYIGFKFASSFGAIREKCGRVSLRVNVHAAKGVSF